MVGDHEVDGAADAVVVDADGDDIMTVMGNRRGDGAAREAEIPDKGFCDRAVGMVAVDDDDLQDVIFGVGVEAAVRGQTVGNGYDQAVGDELAVEGFDDIDLFDIFFFAPFIEEIGEIFGGMRIAVKVIDRLVNCRRGWDMGNSVVGDDLAADDGLEYLEIHQVFDENEVGVVAGAE